MFNHQDTRQFSPISFRRLFTMEINNLSICYDFLIIREKKSLFCYHYKTNKTKNKQTKQKTKQSKHKKHLPSSDPDDVVKREGSLNMSRHEKSNEI
jgi:hypothetical protein